METIGKWQKSWQTRSSLAIIVTAAVLIELTVAIQYWYAREGIQREVERRAKSELRVQSLEIQNVMTAVEVAVKNYVWVFEEALPYPDTFYDIERRLAGENEQIWGCAVAFIPNYYPQKGIWYEPYTFLHDGAPTEHKQIGGPNHDYTQLEFYKRCIEGDSAFWSEPYLDPDGAHGMVTTYSMPIHDRNGRCVAVVGADVALDWLSDVLDMNASYTSSYDFIISRNGMLMASPVESLAMQRNIEEISSYSKNASLQGINKLLKEGQHGQTTVIDENGEKNYIFFAPIKGNTGWSMAVVCPDKEIFAGLRRMGVYLTLLMLIGLALLTFIVIRSIYGFKKLQKANADKEMIDSELRIANEIQVGMLPKVYPPYPERNDIEVYGSLVPAKEVGGDLYDFFLRDEKLFFCIGDVSGKGVPAALMMSVTRTLFRTLSANESSPDKIIERMNDTMAEMNERNMFATMFVGVLDLPTGVLDYCNAGHCPPILLSDKVSKLGVKANIPVGFMRGNKFVSQQLKVNPGTIIFLYTDGLTEADDDTHVQFGISGVVGEAQKMLANGLPLPKEFISNMTEAVHAFVDGNEQSDDLTMLAVEYTNKNKETSMCRSLVLPNDIQTIGKLTPFIEDIVSDMGYDPSVTMKLNLAIEEAVVNVMNYAYPEGSYGEVTVEAQASDDQMKFVITDKGVPFDPTKSEVADTTLSAEERPVGGLGIHLVKNLMDSITYERVDGKNVLTLIKNPSKNS